MTKEATNSLQVRKYPSMTALQCFEATARHLSFTQAGKELHMTQSAVSKQVAQLEELLGLPLFYRASSRLFLTPAGKHYYPEVLRTLQELEAATLALMSYSQDSQTLRIISHPTLCAKWLIAALAGFGATYPEIHLDIKEQASPLMDDDMEVAFLYGNGAWADMEAIKLFDEYSLAVCSPNYQKIGDLQTLSQSDLIAIRTRPRAWQIYFAKQGVRYQNQAAICFDTFHACIQAAQLGYGVALVPIGFVAQALTEGSLVPAYPYRLAGRGAYYMLYPPRLGNTPKVKAMRAWIENYLANHTSKEPIVQEKKE